ncbi:MAG TPA: monovalent cation/H(+) antiporter subunit G [Casimicrobiaceae bacterium]|nr:monovalent cation/H(+) antiporter subunit G [Casimicrobiaceae bacterium]
MSVALPVWIDAFVALLLFASGVLTLTGAIGLFRYGTFFQRMHPPALTATLCAACVTTASIVFFSAVDGLPALYPILINVLLALTTPVTTLLLARAALRRASSANVPPPLSPRAQAVKMPVNPRSSK